MSRARVALLVLAATRGVLAAIAIPLVPVLFREHFVVLVLIRPTKEVLLAAGFLLRRGEVNLLPVLVAAAPLMVGGVWLFYFLGRSFAEEIQSGDDMPRWARRILPPERIQDLCRVLDREGRPLVVAGRLAAFPSTLLAAAAGASSMKPAEFLPADALGAVLSVVEVMVAGFVLGEAYERAGPWLTAVGVAVLIGLLIFLGRWLRRQDKSRTRS